MLVEEYVLGLAPKSGQKNLRNYWFRGLMFPFKYPIGSDNMAQCSHAAVSLCVLSTHFEAQPPNGCFSDKNETQDT